MPLSIVLLFLGLAGCEESGSRPLDVDAGEGSSERPLDSDAGARCDRDVGPSGPPFFCLGHHGPICNDQALPPLCVEGAWQCPEGYLPQGEAECSCAVSTPCLEQGSTCGSCPDSCDGCVFLSCGDSGLWERVVTAAPPAPCTSFECGPELRCAAEREYCAHTLSDVAGVPDGYECIALPTDCDECSCLPSPESCEQGSEGGLTVTLGGG